MAEPTLSEQISAVQHQITEIERAYKSTAEDRAEDAYQVECKHAAGWVYDHRIDDKPHLQGFGLGELLSLYQHHGKLPDGPWTDPWAEFGTPTKGGMS